MGTTLKDGVLKNGSQCDKRFSVKAGKNPDSKKQKERIDVFQPDQDRGIHPNQI